MVPIWGKLSDLHGRKPVLLAGIAIFLVGSWLAGLSGEFGHLPILGGGMTQLIAFRALQGLGGGALFTTAFAIIAELYPPRERAKFSGLFGSIFGVSSVFGPVIGGFFTDHGTVRLFGYLIQGWRWVFYVNVPFALAAVAMILTKMPAMPPHGRGKIDYLGAVLMISAFVPLLLAVTWGGRDYPWASPQVLGLFALALVSLAGFLVVERTVRDPILPLGLFGNPTFVTANAASFAYAMAYMGTTAFLPLFMQVGQGVPATRSGLIMLALMFGMISSSAVCGQLVTRVGKLKPFMLAGGLLLIAGVTSLCFIGPDTSTQGLVWRLLLVGVGLGPGQSLFSLAVQNTVPFYQLGVATSSGQFVRQIGQTMGVALFGALLTAGLSSELRRHEPAAPASAVVHHLDLSDLQRMAMQRSLHPELAPARAADPAARAMDRDIRESFSVAIVHGMFFSLATLIVGFIIMLLIPEGRLRERRYDALPAALASSEPDDGAAMAAEHAGEELKL
jgi:MFS family permease